MTAMQLETFVAPSAWASYLLNGDDSGLEPGERDVVDSFLLRQGVNRQWLADCEDAGFRWTHDATHETPLGADCQHYRYFRRA